MTFDKFADVPRDRLEESRRIDELKLRVTQLEAELAAERAAPEPIQCETCQGTGKINEVLGGYSFSDPSATCPDCDGSGELESIHDFRAGQWWVKELDGILGSPSPDVTPDQKRAVAVVHNLLRHVANLGQVTVTTDESGRAVAVTRQDDDHRILSVIWEAPPVTAPVRLTNDQVGDCIADDADMQFQNNPIKYIVVFARAVEAAVLRANGFDVQPTEAGG